MHGIRNHGAMLEPSAGDSLITLRLPLDAAAPARTRASLAGFRDTIPRFDDAMLLVSEIVTNALEHGPPLPDGSIEVSVVSLEETIRVEIASGVGDPPEPHASIDPSRIRGRGLQLVQNLSAAWGFYGADTLVVWFEMSPRQPRPTRAPEPEDLEDAFATARYLDLIVSREAWNAISVKADRFGTSPAFATSGHFFTTRESADTSSARRIVEKTVARPGVEVTAAGGDGADPAIIERLARLIAAGAPRTGATPRNEGDVLADLRYLAEASQLLASSLDYEETLRMIARLAVPARADWCTINLVDGTSGIRRVAVEHANATYRQQLERLLGSHPHDPDAESGVPLVIRTGRPLLVPEVDDQLLEETANSPEYLEITRALNIRSCIIVPLMAEGEVLGAASFVSTDRNRIHYDEHALEIAMDLSRRAATAIVNARKYSDRNRLVGALTATLLPDRLPAIPGFELAMEYRSAIGDLEVGGDFYDVVPATDAWYVMVGDVQGKGIEAATLIGLARHTLRAAALRGDDPADALTTLNRALLASPIDRTCTVVCARFEAEGATTRMRLARAGHPAPLALVSGAAVPIEPPGILLGFVDEPGISESETLLGRGDLVVFLTDGVTALFDEDETAIAAAVEAAAPDPAAVAAALAGSPDAVLRDDIAVVVARVTTPTTAPDRAPA